MQALPTRVQGSLRPDIDVLLIDQATGTYFDDLESYAWQVEAVGADDITAAKLWTKTTGLTATATGVTVTPAVGDWGALTASGRFPVDYVLEFTGTNGSRPLIVQFEQTITPAVS